MQQPGLSLLVSQRLKLGDWLDSSRCSADSHSSLLHVPAGPPHSIIGLPMLQHKHIDALLAVPCCALAMRSL